MSMPAEKKFNVLCEIVRASHFEWLRAVKAVAPDLDETRLVKEYWTEVGRDTAKAYLPHIDAAKPLPEQVARSFSFSSQCMGEDCETRPGKDESEYFAEHKGCPWLEWHEKEGRRDQDLPGCNAWLGAVVDGINESLGTKLRFETLKSLPGGDDVCLRRFWVE